MTSHRKHARGRESLVTSIIPNRSASLRQDVLLVFAARVQAGLRVNSCEEVSRARVEGTKRAGLRKGRGGRAEEIALAWHQGKSNRSSSRKRH